jgi:hypothetical protein
MYSERKKLIGECPEIDAMFGDVPVRCLIDSGSQVTTTMFTSRTMLAHGLV